MKTYDASPQIIAENPENQFQARLFLCMFMQSDANIIGHPTEIMKHLAEKHNFTVLDALPQSIADGWDFWIEYEKKPETLPNIFRAVPWKPIGRA